MNWKQDAVSSCPAVQWSDLQILSMQSSFEESHLYCWACRGFCRSGCRCTQTGRTPTPLSPVQHQEIELAGIQTASGWAPGWSLWQRSEDNFKQMLINVQIDYGSHQRKHCPFLYYPNYSEGLEIIWPVKSHKCECQPSGFGWITENDDFNPDVSVICAVLTLHKDVYWGVHLENVGGRHHLPEGKYFQKWFYLLDQ